MTFPAPDNFSAASPTLAASSPSPWLFRQYRPTLTVLLTSAILGCGCHKKTEAKPPPAATTTPTVPGLAGQPLPASSQTVAANANVETAAEQLSMELRRYVAYTRSIPKNFEEFTAHDPIKFPPPPAGKKYVILGGKVLLE